MFTNKVSALKRSLLLAILTIMAVAGVVFSGSSVSVHSSDEMTKEMLGQGVASINPSDGSALAGTNTAKVDQASLSRLNSTLFKSSLPQGTGNGAVTSQGDEHVSLNHVLATPKIFSNLLVAPTVRATMVDTLVPTGNNGDNRADPGDTIIYNVTINVTGADAANVAFTDTIDAHTTYVAGSLNVSPLAGDDTYETIGNTLLEVGPVASPSARPKITVTGSVLDNDVDFPNSPAPTLKAPFPTTSTNGGTVAMDASGHFSFTPKEGSTINDTFTYTITDKGADGTAGNADDLTSTATVTIIIKTPRIWYVDNTAGAGGKGRSTDPFNNLAAAQVNSAAGDIIYVFTGDGTTTGQNFGIALQANQQLIGNGVALQPQVTVNGVANPLLRGSGAPPSITNTANVNAGGNGVAATNISGVVIAGFNISSTNNSAIDVSTSAGGTGSALISNNTITGATTEGIDINGAGSGGLTVAINNNAITATGNGLDINGAGGGTLFITSLASNSINGNTAGTGIAINAATFDATPGGTLNTGTDTVSGGNTVIGVAGNGVGINGLDLSAVKGNIAFSDLDIVTAAGTGLKISAAFGPLQAATGTAISVVSGVGTIDATGGPAVDITGSPTIDLQLTSIKSTSPTTGISLSGTVGPFSAGSTSTITATGNDIDVSGGSGNFTYDAPINNTAGRSVSITGRTGGNTVAFNGKITDSGSSTGISLTNNGASGGATINFTGGLDISTGANAAFTATGGGTVNATQNNGTIVNKLVTTTGTALNVQNTTIGASGLTFRSIDAPTSSTSAGVILINTGASGGLTVTGTGSANSGGTISNKTGGAVTSVPLTTNGATTGVGYYLKSTKNVSLTSVHLTSFTNFAIFGDVVDGFTLASSTIDGINGDDVGQDESAINIHNLTGTANITSCTIQGGREDNVKITNDTGTLTAFNITNSTIKDNSTASDANNGLLFVNKNTAIVTAATISGSTFSGTHATGIQVDANNTSTITNFTVQNSTFSNNNVAINFTQSQSGNTTFNILTNTFNNHKSVVINMFSASASTGGTMTGKVQGNTIGTQGVGDSGSGLGQGIRVSLDGQCHGVFRIDNNTIREIENARGIDLIGRLGTGEANFTVSNNTVVKPTGLSNETGCTGSAPASPCPLAPIWVESATGNTVYANVFGNLTYNPQDFPSGGEFAYRLKENVTGSPPSSTFFFEGSAANATTQLTNTNDPDSPISVDAGVSMVPAGSTETIALNQVQDNGVYLAEAGGDSSVVSGRWLTAQSVAINQVMAEHNLLDSALVWMNEGRNTTSLPVSNTNAVGTTLVAFADPSRTTIAASSTNIIKRADVRAVESDSVALAQADHQSVRGSDSTRAGKARNSRQLSHAIRIRTRAAATAATLASPLVSGETVPATIGAIPQNKSVIVQFKVTLDNPPNLDAAHLVGGPHVTNQGTVNYTGGSVQTDDTSVGANTVETDPNVTPVDLFDTTTVVVSDDNTTFEGDPVTFTATVTPTQGLTAPSPDGTVQFKDGVTDIGSPVTCVDATPATPGDPCTAQLTTSTLPAGARSITAVYSGGSNHETSTSPAITQTVTPCNSAPSVTSNLDDGSAGTLRSAIAGACTTASITFTLGAGNNTITLNPASGELQISKNLTIDGTGVPGGLIIDANHLSRIFNVDAGKTVTIKNLTIINGQASSGGGINSLGNLTISSVTFTGNKAVGAGAKGGAIDSEGGTLTIVNSTISGNTSDGNGGGLYNGGTSTATLANVTITNNSADANNDATGAGGGISQASSNAMTLRNTIVAGNFNEDGATDAPDDVFVDTTLPSIINAASSHNLIGVDTGLTGISNGDANGNQVGTVATPLDPRLAAALANNGGPTQTYALLAGSPALDAGDDCVTQVAHCSDALLPQLTTDQRGTGFGRKLDAGDLNTTQTVDIGAFEADPAVEDITDKSTNEDTALSFSFNVGDAATAFSSITAVATTNPGLVSTITVTPGADTSKRMLNITPASNTSGTATITVTVSKTVSGTPLTMTDTFVLTVNSVNDAPTLDAIPDPAAILEDAGLQTINLTGITAGPVDENTQGLTVTATSGNTGLIPNPTVNYTSPNATGSLTYTPVANQSGTALITVTVTDDGGTANSGVNSFVRTFTVTVTAVNDAPTLDPIPDPAAILEDAGLQTVNLSGIAAGGGETQTLSITATSGNTGLIPNPTVNYTSPNATGSLTYTPVANQSGTALITVTVNDGGGTLNGGVETVVRTFTVTVTAVNDAPTLNAIPDPAAILEDAGLQTVNLSGIAAGPVNETGQSLTVTATSGNTGLIPNPTVNYTSPNATGSLTYTPVPDQYVTALITVTVTDDGGTANSGVNSFVRTFTVTVNPTPDTPQVTPNPISTAINTQTTGQIITPAAGDGPIVQFYKITNITNGTLFKNDGLTAIPNNSFITLAEGAAGLKFTPTANLTSPTNTFSFQVQSSSDAVGTLISPTPATASIIVSCTTAEVVNNLLDDGSAGSLRYAVANACPGSVVTFNLGAGTHTIPLASPITINKDVTIQGSDSTSPVIISGNTVTRVFSITNGNVTIRDLTISGGSVTGSNGAGLLNTSTGLVTISNSLFTANTVTTGSGGAIASTAGTVNIYNTTISGNTATDGGGVYHNTAGTVTVLNSTIYDNHADAGAGQGGGINSAGGTTTIRNSIVAGNTASTNINVAGGVTNLGESIVTGDPKVSALADNGGPTFTHALLPGSPALDQGNNGASDGAGLTTDQRGSGFARKADGPDADTTTTVDIGAFEAHPSVEDITDKTTTEDAGLAPIVFNVGDAVLGIGSVTATSSNQLLIPAANVSVTGSGSTRTLTLTPLADKSGTTTITVTVTSVIGGQNISMVDTFVVTVGTIPDTPSVTNAITNEDTQTTLGLVATINPVDGGEITHFKITGLTGGTLFKNDGFTVIPNNSFITVAEGNAGLKFTPNANLFSPTTTFGFQVQSSTDNVGTILSASAATATITVNPIADTPSVTNATTNEDTQTAAGQLVISRNAVDSTEVTHFKITGITGGTLFKNNGTTQINDGDFITFAEGNAGLRFTPAANSSAPGSFQVQGATSAAGAGLSAGLAAATITVNTVPDIPTVTNATTNEDTQTTSGLVITRNAADGAEVTNFKITNITGGTLYKHDGVTVINNGDFITVAEGADVGGFGLKFTPAANSNVNGSFQVQSSLSALDAGLGGALATATITVNPVNDAPTLDALGDLTINEDAPLQTVNLTGIAAGGGETQTLVITATSSNTGLIPNPTVNYTSPNATGSITFTPVAEQSGTALITVTVNDGGGTANGGVATVVRTFTVTVNAVNDAPVNNVPGAQTTDENTPRTFSAANSNLISISDVDAGVAAVQVTLTVTNGTVSLSSTAGLAFTTGDGTADATMTFTGTIASINSALSGLVFTPTTGFHGAASIQITTNDQGNLGAGGALSDTDTIPITVIERNMKFDATNYTAAESAGHATITVIRAGGTTLPATVDFETSDLSGLNNCNVNTGLASQRCDYTTMRGTLNFSAGQTSATFDIPIINDVYVEGPETLTLTLINPTGGILGNPSTATLTITDNDTTPGAQNPIDTVPFFIRQQYLDFLNREPEPSGLADWLAIINNCPAGDTSCDYIQVSSGFFRSQEFFDRAYYVYRFYETALGRKPTYDEYQHDIARLTGFLTPAQLEQRKAEYAEEFSHRADFKALYDSTTDGDGYVNAIVATAGVTPSNRTDVAIREGALLITRGRALRELLESPEISQHFYNKAFVVVGYFAYLRRDPDAAYLVWLDLLNNPPANRTYQDIYREMIRGFIESQEYRARFGLP
jgi:hypothetical protein